MMMMMMMANTQPHKAPNKCPPACPRLMPYLDALVVLGWPCGCRPVDRVAGQADGHDQGCVDPGAHTQGRAGRVRAGRHGYVCAAQHMREAGVGAVPIGVRRARSRGGSCTCIPRLGSCTCCVCVCKCCAGGKPPGLSKFIQQPAPPWLLVTDKFRRGWGR